MDADVRRLKDRIKTKKPLSPNARVPALAAATPHAPRHECDLRFIGVHLRITLSVFIRVYWRSFADRMVF